MACLSSALPHCSETHPVCLLAGSMTAFKQPDHLVNHNQLVAVTNPQTEPTRKPSREPESFVCETPGRETEKRVCVCSWDSHFSEAWKLPVATCIGPVRRGMPLLPRQHKQYDAMAAQMTRTSTRTHARTQMTRTQHVAQAKTIMCWQLHTTK